MLRLQSSADYRIRTGGININGNVLEDPYPDATDTVAIGLDGDFSVLDYGYEGAINTNVTLGPGSAVNNSGPLVDILLEAAARGSAGDNLPSISTTSRNQVLTSGAISYNMAVVKMHPDAPDGIEIPVLYSTFAELTAAAAELTQTPFGEIVTSFATANAAVRVFNEPADPLIDFEACAGFGCAPGSVETFQESGSIDLAVYNNTTVTVNGSVNFGINGVSQAIVENGQIVGYNIYADGGETSAQVVATAPVFTLDDTFQVDFLGDSVAATDVYTIAVAQGIGFTGNFPVSSPFTSGCLPQGSLGPGLGSIGAGSAITCSGVDNSGYMVANDLLEITVLADALVTTDDMTAMRTIGIGNSVDNQGEIATSEDMQSAVYMTGAANIVLNDGFIQTAGADAAAVAIQATDPTISFVGGVENDGLITTTGEGSDAVRLEGEEAIVNNFEFGVIETLGNNSDALRIQGNNASVANFGEITTAGDDADAISVSGNFDTGAAADGATVANNGLITTAGQRSAAVAVNANGAFVQNAGSIETTATDNGVSPTLAPGIFIVGDDAVAENLGGISTAGTFSPGIGVLGARGEVINAGNITTSGASGFGIIALTSDDDTPATSLGGPPVEVLNDQLGNIRTSGQGAHGIAFGTSDAALLGQLTAAFGINPALGVASGEVINRGSIITQGAGAHGVAVNARQTQIVNEGSITANGDGSSGLFIEGSQIRLDNSGTIESATAVAVWSEASGFTLNNTGTINDTVLLNGNSTIVNEGDMAGVGMFAGAGTVNVENRAGASMDRIASIEEAQGEVNVTNDGTITSSDGAAVSLGVTNRASVINRGTIEADSDSAGIGIIADGDTTDVDISNEGVIVAGAGIAVGVEAGRFTIENSGTIQTTSVEGDGIEVIQADRSTVVNSGQIQTTGASAIGMSVTAQNVNVTNNGNIATIGADAAGVVALQVSSAGEVETANVTNRGGIVTAGVNADGIRGLRGLNLQNTGDVIVDGANAYAVRMGNDQLVGGSGDGLTLNNLGSLQGINAVLGSAGGDSIDNTGSITGAVQLLGGSDQLILREGSLFTGLADAGADTDLLSMEVATQSTLNADNFINFENFTRSGAGLLTVNGTLDVDNAALNAGNTQMNDATVTGNVQVNAGAELSGNFMILGDLDVTGGLVTPGFSPGMGSVGGNFLLDGIFEVEFGGTQPGLFDQLFVQGDLILGDNSLIRFLFLDNFVPDLTDAFEFLNVAGDVFGLDNLTFEGLPGDFGVDIDLFAGTFTFAADGSGPGPGPTPVPEPGTLMLLVLGLTGLVLVRVRERRVMQLAPKWAGGNSRHHEVPPAPVTNTVVAAVPPDQPAPADPQRQLRAGP